MRASLFHRLARSIVFVGFALRAGAANDETLDVRQLEVPPALVQSIAPEYPERHRLAGTEGFVVLEFVVGRDGRVGAINVLRATHGDFVLAATDAVQRWRFSPGKVKGRAVNTRVQQEFPFMLVDEPKELRLTVLRATDAAAPEWDTPPKPANGSPAALYPTEALLKGEDGGAVIEFVVSVDGRVRDAVVREATQPEFAQAAIAALNETLFSPAQRKGQAVPAHASASYQFKADGKGDVEVPASTRALITALQANPALVQAVPRGVQPRPWRVIGPMFPNAIANTQSQGEAVIEIVIDRNGRPQLPKVISCTAPEFGAAAARAVAMWRFLPIQVDGKPIVTRVQIPFGFDRAKEQPTR